jgi:hypothetical protein
MKEVIRKIVEAKKAEVERPVVYTGRIENGQWIAESLRERYKDIVKIVEVIEGVEPEKVIEGYEFIGGNSNRLVYMRKEFVKQWLETANHDSHWGSAAVLRPGKLARSQVVIDWSGYAKGEEDEGLLAIMS